MGFWKYSVYHMVFACICFDILFDPFSPREKSCHYRRQYFLLWRVVPGLAAIPAGFDSMCHCSCILGTEKRQAGADYICFGFHSVFGLE